MTSTFAFEALTRDGRVERGLLHAASPAGARAQLTSRGFVVLALTNRPMREGKSRVGPRDLATGLRILANLSSSGIPLTRALRAFEDLAPQSWRAALPAVTDQITQGATLAMALENSPLDVPQLVLGMVRAGEAGAGIAAGLEQAAAMAESSAELRGALRAAVAYPMVVATAGAGSIAILLTVVLPRFATILADFQQQLPPTTRFVLATASAAPRIGLVAAVIGAIAFACWYAWTSTALGRRQWAELVLAVPGVGVVQRAASTARVTMSLSALLKSGVPIASAISLAGRASGNAAVEHRVLCARERVNGGASLADALSAENAVTVAAARLAKAGEEAGNTPAMLAHAGNLERDRAERIVRTSVRLLEPLLLLLFAGVVGLIAAALLQAVYSIRPSA